jgi:hypothetical protein
MSPGDGRCAHPVGAGDGGACPASHGDGGQFIDGQRDASVSGPEQRAVAYIGEVRVVQPAAAGQVSPEDSCSPMTLR